ncbi:hypothetical protein TNCV_2032881 [Trichonephila clavipes]|nr:hypothetical protein TNCV_2032881 [Trichonephila clavipes]
MTCSPTIFASRKIYRLQPGPNLQPLAYEAGTLTCSHLTDVLQQYKRKQNVQSPLTRIAKRAGCQNSLAQVTPTRARLLSGPFQSLAETAEVLANDNGKDSISNSTKTLAGALFRANAILH